MPDMLLAIRDYIARGWSPVPIPRRKKGPALDAWQDLRIDAEAAPAYFNGTRQNVGVILGKASGGLTDLDLDCPEAIAAAGYILPASALFGRSSKPASHWLYRTNLFETQDRAAIKFMGSDKHGLLEIRMGAGGFAAQTVFPPSTHVSGEPIEWADSGPRTIADVDGDELVQRARRLAAAAELARNYPKAGVRHDAAFMLGSFLARCGFSPSAAATLVEAVGAASLQPDDKRHDMGRTARDGANALTRAGFPALAETFGQATAKKVADWLGYTGATERPDVVEASAPRAERPTIELRVGETERTVDELESLLIASKRGLYQRGGLIVSTGFDKMQTWDSKAVVSQNIEERGDYALLEDAEAVAKFVRFDAEGNARPAPLPMALIRTFKDREHRLRLRVLVGIVNCPSISADGQLLDRPGFDPETGVLYDPLGVIFPSVPSLPDRRTALTALERILKLLETFEFVGKDDKAVALSLIFTAIARRGLPHAPLHGFDAPVAGSGKSMLVDIASILATGHEAGVIAQGESREEAEKRLAATLMRGSPIIAVDNCELPLEGVLLNQALTQQRVELRILGFSKMIVAQTMTLLTATGNNLTIKGDLTRRSVVSRLDPKVAQPELRDFAYDPLADAKANRGELVAAVLTALIAYHVAGRPKRPTPPLQSFVKWSDTVRGALMWLDQGDPVGTMARLREADPTIINLKAVLTAWRDDFGDEPTTAKDAVAAADATIATREPGTLDRSMRTHTYPALRAALLMVAGRGAAIDTRVLDQWLGRHVDRVVDLGNSDFVALEMPGLLHGDRRWKVTAKPPKKEEG